MYNQYSVVDSSNVIGTMHARSAEPGSGGDGVQRATYQFKGTIWVDKFAHNCNKRLSFRSDLAYGKVFKFFTQTFCGEDDKVALVKLFPGFEQGRYGYDSCSGTLPHGGGLYMMEVSQIDGLVGTLYNSATNRTYIILSY